jgi:hypothetical protein
MWAVGGQDVAEVSRRPHYTAFISYCHRDGRAAGRLHRRLEGFRIDKDLAGRETPMGSIPTSLRPIFRDRAEFDAGSSLGAQTHAALEKSAALIVLASPAAAASHYVNEEVRLFRHSHPDRPVIPVIVAGAEGVTDKDVFPPALRFLVGADGTISDTPIDVLAADEREVGDGRDLALSKLVARLIGLGTDEVFRRAERERRRQARVRMAVLAVIVALGVGGGLVTWHARQSDRQLADVEAIVAQVLPVNSAMAAVPGERENLTRRITAIAANGGTDPRNTRALELIKAGQTAAAACSWRPSPKMPRPGRRGTRSRPRKRFAAPPRSLV